MLIIEGREIAVFMGERKKLILQAITDDYIRTAEPIGSRTIARKYNLGISPATIRNEMADLEESGYLQQPHTSAGRVPSSKGYRFYVDSLMEVKELSGVEMQNIYENFRTKETDIERYDPGYFEVHRPDEPLCVLGSGSEYTAICVQVFTNDSLG